MVEVAKGVEYTHVFTYTRTLAHSSPQLYSTIKAIVHMATATVFKFYLFHMSWRRVLIVASIISICFSLNDVVGVAFFGDSSSSCSVYLSFDICGT
eukprot:FR739539.1.p1 GENE.FR739539.1~~FR739539.1.p1  ORF type:complete len:109 (+),score=5.79 FR739539.1:41-328(+)